MREGPDISAIAALIGNPASAHMLMALMAGPALTASGHLAKLAQAGLVAVARQGRHRYFRLADADVALPWKVSCRSRRVPDICAPAPAPATRNCDAPGPVTTTWPATSR